jgi:tetratricopeptide (TPR) repeat protein
VQVPLTTNASCSPPAFPQLAAGGVLAAIVVCVIYWPTLGNGFVWDDHSYVTFSPVLHDSTRWAEALLQPLTGDTVFRPLTLFTFVLQLWTGQTAAAPYHAVNLALHAANVVLVTFLAWVYAGRHFASTTVGVVSAALVGLVYGLHPAISESVLWISCRFDLMMACFLFLALLVDGTGKDMNWGRALATGTLFLAALLSKETAIGFLAAFPLFHLAVDRVRPGPLSANMALEAWASHRKAYAMLLTACVVYLLLRYAVLGPSFGMEKVLLRFTDIGSEWQRALVVAASLIHYVADAIWPTPNVMPNRTLSFPVDGGLGAIAVVAILGAVFLLVFTASRIAVARAPALLMLAFLCAMLPVANVVPAPTYSDELQIASRYLTFPLAFVCLAVCLLLANLKWVAPRGWFGAPRLSWLFLVIWIVASAFIVRGVTPHWKDEGAFFRWAIEGANQTSLPYLYMNLGAYYVGRGDMGRARDVFGRATRLKHRNTRLASLIWYNLGNADEKLGNAERAVYSYRQAIGLDPDNVYSRAGLARLELVRGNGRGAAVIVEEGLSRLHASGQRHLYVGLLHHQLGLAYYALGFVDDAIYELGVARDAAPNPELRAQAEKDLKAVLLARKRAD